MYAIFVDAQSLNLTCKTLQYSLTGLPNDWHSSPYFFNLQEGQTYRVRIKDTCTGCVYEKDYTIEKKNLIRPEDCPCCGKIHVSIPSHPINWVGDSSLVEFKIWMDDCCEDDAKIVSPPWLRNGVEWTSETIAMFPIKIPKSTAQEPYSLSLSFSSPPNSSVAPFVSELVIQGCGCDGIYRIPLFFVKV